MFVPHRLLTFAKIVTGRLAIGCLTFGLFTLGLTPYCWPTYLMALSPLILLWRCESLTINFWAWLVIEAIAVGMAMCWMSTSFITPLLPIGGSLLHCFGCLIYSTLTVAIALSLRWTRSLNLPLAAAVTAVLATAVEFIQARTLGVTWILSNPGLAVASTPVAQWSGVLTPFGLSALLYWINFSWLPFYSRNDNRWRWTWTFSAFTLTALLWLGGIFLESRVAVGLPPFSSMLVQPSGATSSMPERLALWQTLDSATSQSLATDGIVDLVLWPETCLWDSWYNELEQHTSEQPADNKSAVREESSKSVPLTLPAFRQRMAINYQTNCLVGVCLLVNGMAEKYGLTVHETHRYNCACLVGKDGKICSYEKMAIMPLREGFPYWYDWEWLKNNVKKNSNVNPNISAGRNFQTLTFTDSAGETRMIAVAICYESWFPWLPQYHCDEPLDAICHLAYDGDFKEHPEYTQRMLLTIRLRAIETRTWQLVCSHYAGTAVIDPRGRIVKQLPPGPGVLRTDRME